MYILSHRGFWQNEKEKNSIKAIRNSLINGFGFESDIRDYDGKIVISHDMATTDSFFASEVFKLINEINKNCCFAINVKSDGLNKQLLSELNKYNINNYFTFDMSVPQMIEYLKMGINVFTRQSEFEKQPVLYDEVNGVWIDGFYDTDWITQELLNYHIAHDKQVCLVSPELHNREYNVFWQRLKAMDTNFDKIMLCTDIPDKAKSFFPKI